MSTVDILAAHERRPDRPFTDPEQTHLDHDAMADALESLRRLLSLPGDFGARQEWQEKGLYRRLILGDCQRLRTLPRLVFVGFFGQRRRVITVDRINVLDEDLLTELAQQPGVLAYYTLELPSEDYGNLVLFSSEEAKRHWSTSQLHTDAVRELAPHYYNSVRIHNGTVAGGLLGNAPLLIERTKYYDYDQPWRAIRELSGAENTPPFSPDQRQSPGRDPSPPPTSCPYNLTTGLFT